VTLPTATEMDRYVVLDATADGRLLVLRDGRGRYHVARPGLTAPPLGADLEGFEPERGSALLASVPAGPVYRVTFEHLDISQQAALNMLHPPAPPQRPQALRLVSTTPPLGGPHDRGRR
jgi:hypothetical protein